MQPAHQLLADLAANLRKSFSDLLIHDPEQSLCDQPGAAHAHALLVGPVVAELDLVELRDVQATAAGERVGERNDSVLRLAVVEAQVHVVLAPLAVRLAGRQVLQGHL